MRGKANLLICASSWTNSAATLENLETMRVILENCNDEVATMEERVTDTREGRDRLQLRHNEAGMSLVTTQQELAEARLATTRALEAEMLKDRQTSEGPGDRGNSKATQLQ